MGRSKKSVETVKESASSSPTPMEATMDSPSESPKEAKAGGKRSRRESESSSASAGNPRKRGRRTKAEVELELETKRVKLTSQGETRGVGHVLTLGQGDTGQLGLGEDIMERARPALVKDVENAVDVVAGGMHTVVLDTEGDVWTFGCNDEGSLGRVVEEEEECFIPGKVSLPEKVVQISAGDSHSAALTESGQVWLWGTFRDSSGPIGLLTWAQLEKEPVKVALAERDQVVRIVSGGDHLAMLTQGGDIFTMGNSEQGQLGRVPEKFGHRGGRRGGQMLLRPDKIHSKSKSKKFSNVWAGSYNTVALTTAGEVLVMGLNNYSQMGIDHNKSGLTFFMPVVSDDLSGREWSQIAIGQHHTLGLDSQGKVFCLGRSEYGRLGLGEAGGDAGVATAVTALQGEACQVACGTAVSYGVTSQGLCYSWGMGTNGQLGTGEEDDLWEPTVMKSKQLEGREVLAVSSGGQHTVILARDKK